MTAIDTLTRLGFAEQDAMVFQAISDQLGLSENGDHKVKAYYTKGDVTAIIEQNVSPDTSGGVEIITKHPAILILESPNGRVSISNQDDPANAALIEQVVLDLDKDRA